MEWFKKINLRFKKKHLLVLILMLVFFIKVFIFFNQNIGDVKNTLYLYSGDIIHGDLIYYLTNNINTLIEDADFLKVTGHSKFYHFIVSLFNITTGLKEKNSIFGISMFNMFLYFLSNLVLYKLVKIFICKNKRKEPFIEKYQKEIPLFSFILFNAFSFTNTFFIIGNQGLIIFSFLLLLYCLIKFNLNKKAILISALILTLNSSFNLYLLLGLFIIYLVYKNKDFNILICSLTSVILSFYFLGWPISYISSISLPIQAVLYLIAIIILIVLNTLKHRKIFNKIILIFLVISMSGLFLYLFIPNNLHDFYHIGVVWNYTKNKVSYENFVKMFNVWGFFGGLNVKKGVFPWYEFSTVLLVYYLIYLIYQKQPFINGFNKIKNFIFLGLGIIFIQFLISHLIYPYFIRIPLGNFSFLRSAMLIKCVALIFTPLLFTKRFFINKKIIMGLAFFIVIFLSLDSARLATRQYQFSIEHYYSNINKKNICEKEINPGTFEEIFKKYDNILKNICE